VSLSPSFSLLVRIQSYASPQSLNATTVLLVPRCLVLFLSFLRSDNSYWAGCLIFLHLLPLLLAWRWFFSFKIPSVRLLSRHLLLLLLVPFHPSVVSLSLLNAVSLGSPLLLPDRARSTRPCQSAFRRSPRVQMPQCLVLLVPFPCLSGIERCRSMVSCRRSLPTLCSSRGRSSRNLYSPACVSSIVIYLLLRPSCCWVGLLRFFFRPVV